MADGSHPTTWQRHQARLMRRQQQQSEHPSLKFRITVAGGIPIHKSTLNFTNARVAVRQQAEAGRGIWVRETWGNPVLILELNHKGYGHVYKQAGTPLPIREQDVPAWAHQLHIEYVNHYPGGIANV